MLRKASNVEGLSARELIAECAASLNDPLLWREFHVRFKRKITTYLWRACSAHGGTTDQFHAQVEDWLQDVFMKLLQNNGRALREFRGDSEFSINAFLAAVAHSTVADHFRAQHTKMRRAHTVPIHDVNDSQVPVDNRRASAQNSAVLAMIDAERQLLASTSKHPARDLLLFKLHFVEGLTASEIATMPSFGLTLSGVEKVLGRIRSRLVEEPPT